MLTRNTEQIGDGSERPAMEESLIQGNTYQCNTNSKGQEQHLHTQSDLPALSRDGPTPLNNEVTKIIQAARPIFASVITNPGDFDNRVSDTRTRKRPTIGDIANINGAIDVLMKENNGSSNIIDPAQDPFAYLWLANCVLYSIVIALFWSKDGGKTRPPSRQSKVGRKAERDYMRHRLERSGKTSL